MAAQFVIGRAGSGKTRHCRDRIAADLRRDPLGPPIYWLLPRQATFQAEREMTCGMGLPGFCRLRVLSFDMLAQEVLAATGGLAVPEITPLGRQMILGHLLQTHAAKLRHFDRVAHHVGLASRVDQAIGELERCGKSPPDVQRLAEQLAAQDSPDARALSDKLHDLALIYDAYTAYLGKSWLDPARRLARMLEAIDGYAPLRGASVYVDGFAEFDEFQRRVLARIAQNATVQIALLMDPSSPVIQTRRSAPALFDELGLFHQVERTCARLRAVFDAEGTPVEPAMTLAARHRFVSPSLAHVENSMFDWNGPTLAGDADVEMLEAPDRRAEVDAAARRVQDYLAGGLRLRDIAVLVRRLDVYGDLIASSFAEHGIACFIDRRRPVAHHPLMQLVRCALSAANNNWAHDAAMGLAKCGLGGLSPDEADALENYVLLHRLRGKAWTSEQSWNYIRDLSRTDDTDDSPERAECQRLDALRRRLVDATRPLMQVVESGSRPLPLRRLAEALCQTLEAFAVRPQLAGWIESARQRRCLEEAEQHQRVWAELSSLLDQMVELLGDEPMTLEHFAAIVDVGLDGFDLGLTPPAVDEVLVGQVDRTRTPDVKAVLLLGLNDGVFPFSPREGSVFADSERNELRRRDFDVEPDAPRRLLDERLLGYVAFTRASQRLYVSRALSDDAGRPLGPSPFWQRLRTVLRDVPVRTLSPADALAPDAIGTARQLVAATMRWAVAPGPASDSWPAIYNWLATCDHPRTAAVRDSAWPALRYANEARLSPTIATELFASPLRASADQIESFAGCPFQHFARHGLGLEQREDPEPTVLDLSRIYQRILARLVEQMLAADEDFRTLDPARAAQIVEQYADHVAAQLRGELMLGTARNRYLLARVRQALGLAVESQKAMAERGMLRPIRTNVRYGQDDAPLPPLELTTPRGRLLRLHGRIERIDIVQDQADAAVVAYRLKDNTLSLTRVYHGLALRLLTNLLVLRDHGRELLGRDIRANAAVCFKLFREIAPIDHPSESPPDRERIRGLVREDMAGAFDTNWTIGRSSVLSAQRRQDGALSANTHDVAPPAVFESILAHARRCIAALADQIIDGTIDVRPYRLGTSSPCSLCPYLSVCRFDTATNGYRFLTPTDPQHVLARIAEEVGL